MPGRTRCALCGKYSPNAGFGGTVGASQFVDLAKAEVKPVVRIRIGDPWDQVWGPSHEPGFVAEDATLVAGFPGFGKALALDTPIATPSGWTTMGDVRVGDHVFDERGEVCRVIGCASIMFNRPCYRVVFSDKSVIVCDADHLWRTTTRRERADARRASETTNGAVRTTAQIRDSLIDYDTHRNHSIVCAAPLALPDIDLPIPPYTLGVWLGDGSTSDGRITSADPEIARRVREDGYRLSRHKYPSDGRASRWTAHGLISQLRAVGLLGRKCIPQNYLRASVGQRLDLLRGLLDTDGDVPKMGNVCFTTTLPFLRDGFAELLSSLGIKFGRYEKRAMLKGVDCGPAWTFSFTTEHRVFNLSRKLVRQGVGPRGTHRRRYIVTVEPVPSVPVRCIAVDSPSHLYLAGETMIPTHNTTMLLAFAIAFAEVTGKPSYYVCSEQSSDALRRTIDRCKFVLKPGQIHVLTTKEHGAAVDEAVFKKVPPGAIMLDSVTDFCAQDDHRAQMALCKMYREYARKFLAPTFIIIQMNKQGDTAGLQKIQHDVDAIIELENVVEARRINRLMRDYNLDVDGELRCIIMHKNRNGPTGLDFPLVMTGTGLHGVEKLSEKTKSSGFKSGNLIADLVNERALLYEQLEEAQEDAKQLRGSIADINERIDKESVKLQRAAENKAKREAERPALPKKLPKRTAKKASAKKPRAKADSKKPRAKAGGKGAGRRSKTVASAARAR